MLPYWFILPLFLTLSMPAKADDGVIQRCAHMFLDKPAAEAIGFSLKKLKFDAADMDDSQSIVIEPRMAGLRGPSITILGRDARLAVTTQQTSPQELWHKSQWNQNRVRDPCARPAISFSKSIKRGFYMRYAFDHTMGLTTYQPRILYRSRWLSEALLVRPRGFVFGASVAFPLSTNTESLLQYPDSRAPVRRDLARFANGVAVDRAFVSWRGTPATDVHVAMSGGLLEEMYAGVGAEVIWRPFPSPFWIGADAWQVWRRDAMAAMNVGLEDTGSSFTGHIRAGYDVPDTRYNVYAVVGKYLAGDVGATVGASRGFENGARVDATLTWTNRREGAGFFRDTQLDPMLRVVWPLGVTSKTEMRTTLRQVGRDGGQMLDRPMPLERMTESFSGREMVRHWPVLLTKKEAAHDGGL